jgi:hypothetical protein
MSKMTISLTDGEVFRDDKLIATVNGNGKIKFKHYSYKKHRDEIEYLITGDDEGEPVDIGLEPIEVSVPDVVEADKQPHGDAPKHFFEEGNGKNMGEATPAVVLWRKANWDEDKFKAKYDSMTEVLERNFAIEGKKYK